MNGAPWEVPESTQRTPRGFFQAKPKAASEARLKAKIPRGRRPRGFLALGLAEDAA